MIEFKDEVLDTSLQPDRNPRYTIRDNKGKILFDDIQFEMKTPVVQQSTELSRAFFLDIGFHAGMILMWSGSIDTIPTGWALCDGSNGTPDLRNRFIVGAGNSYNVGSTGGSASVTLTEEQIPSHTHGTTIANAGKHSHYYNAPSKHGVTSGQTDYASTTRTTTEEAGNHTHEITIDNTGGGKSHENRPPYYALAYIMKI